MILTPSLGVARALSPSRYRVTCGEVMVTSWSGARPHCSPGGPRVRSRIAFSPRLPERAQRPGDLPPGFLYVQPGRLDALPKPGPSRIAGLRHRNPWRSLPFPHAAGSSSGSDAGVSATPGSAGPPARAGRPGGLSQLHLRVLPGSFIPIAPLRAATNSWYRSYNRATSARRPSASADPGVARSVLARPHAMPRGAPRHPVGSTSSISSKTDNTCPRFYELLSSAQEPSASRR